MARQGTTLHLPGRATPRVSRRASAFIVSVAIHAAVIGVLSLVVLLPRAKRIWEAEIVMKAPPAAKPAPPAVTPAFTKEPKTAAVRAFRPARPLPLFVRQQPLRSSPETRSVEAPAEPAPSPPVVSTTAPPLEAPPPPGGAAGRLSLEAFQSQLLACIERAKRYPRIAARTGMEGTVDISFELTGDGTARDVEVAKSSGYGALDKGGRRAVLEATFPPIPEHFGRDSIRYTVSIRFSLVDR